MDVWFSVALVCFSAAVSGAWTPGLNRKGYHAESYRYPWAPARRSAFYPCVSRNQQCVSTSQCCNDFDVCLTTIKGYNAFSGEKGRTSTCQDVRKEKYAFPLKASGQACTDSSQCSEHCCREVRGHRARYYVCGTPEDDTMSHTCIKASRSENDVLDYFI